MKNARTGVVGCLTSSKFYTTLILLLVLFSIPLIIKNPVFLQLMILVFWYAYLTLSWNIVGGFAGQLSLGHAAFTGIGAYTSTVLFIQFGLSPWLGMLAGGTFAAIIAITIGYPCFRLRGAYFALSTIAFAEALKVLVENTREVFGIPIKGAQGLLVPLKGQSLINFQFLSKAHYYYVILIMMLVALFITYKITKSKLGYYLSAIRNDVDAARSLGINVSRCRLKAAILSAFLTAIGGTFYAQMLLFIDPAGIMGLYLSMEIVFIAIIGGRGTLMGPILGAFFMVPIAEFTRFYFGGQKVGVHFIIYGIALIAIMLFSPRGINDLIVRGYNLLFGEKGRKEGNFLGGKSYDSSRCSGNK